MQKLPYTSIKASRHLKKKSLLYKTHKINQMMHKRQLGGILYIKSQRYQKYENVLVPHLALCTVYIYV